MDSQTSIDIANASWMAAVDGDVNAYNYLMEMKNSFDSNTSERMSNFVNVYNSYRGNQ